MLLADLLFRSEIFYKNDRAALMGVTLFGDNSSYMLCL